MKRKILLFLLLFTLLQPYLSAGDTFQLCDGFTYETVPNDIEKLLADNSLINDPRNDFIRVNDLNYLKIKYWDFNDTEQCGEMLINKQIAREVLEIFKELYDNHFPIASMKLIERDSFESDDEKSMSANNTSALRIAESNLKSCRPWHSLGMAIDINPMCNPCRYPNAKENDPKFVPTNAEKYLDDRSSIVNGKETGIIDKNSVCYRAFNRRGWEWGGSWDDPVDLQHFQKYTWTTEFPRQYA